MILKLVLDRYEENLGVALDDDNKRHYISKDVLGEVKVNDIFTIEYDGESYSSPKILAEETEKKKQELSARMKKLFNMSRHRRPPNI